MKRIQPRSVDLPWTAGASPRRLALDPLLAALRACRNETYALWDHSIRVASTARRLAERMGLPSEHRRLAYLGGLLHDVGKTVCCSEALFKPGPLTTKERKLMNLHPLHGAELVRGLELPSVTEAVELHHELLDGSGYPFGLRGTEIPLVARVVAVADYYEALRECRPYRPVACTPKVALRLVDALARDGKLDPAVCAALPIAVRAPECPSKNFERTIERFEWSF